MRLTAWLIGSAAGLCLSACVTQPAPPAGQTAVPSKGYLSQSQLSDLAAQVSPAPAPGSAEARADAAASERLRTLEDSDRWLLATRHAELRPAVALAHFDCALGFRIEADQSPLTVALLTRVLHDANAAAERAKARTHRPRPVAADPTRRSCQVVSAAGRASASHPSGSASVGAAYGAVLARLVPDRAQALNTIGHQIAVSRAVCGMHYPADIAAGESLGLAALDAMASTPAFMADAKAAGAEIDAARRAGRTSPACSAERAALAIPLS